MNPIVQGIADFFSNLINGIVNDFYRAIGPLIDLIGNTPANFTTGNPVVNGAWVTMVGVADSFLGLYVIMKLIQIMHGEATGTIHVPLSQFIPKVLLTAILIHLSGFFGQQLLSITNTLTALAQTNLKDFIQQVNDGHLLDQQQSIGLNTVLAIGFGIGLIRVFFQAIKRVVFFNLLYALSGPAFLMSLDPQTAPWFQFWLRTYLVTVLTQFFQFFTLMFGVQFLFATKQAGFSGFVLAIALLNLTAEIPEFLSRFATSGANAPGVGEILGSAIRAATVLV